MKINTTPGETYVVLSTGGCTVTTGAGKQIKKLAAGQDFFTAMTGDSVISDDNASVTVAKGEILSLLNTDGTGEDVQATLRFQPVTSQSALPAPGENGVIYLVPNTSTAPNQYTEWVWTGAAYEQLGDVSVDLSGYASKEDLGIVLIDATETERTIISNANIAAGHVYVPTLAVGECVFSGSTDGSNTVTTTGTLSAGTLGGYNVVTTGGAVITNCITVVSEVLGLTDPAMQIGAAVTGYNFTDAQGYRQEGIKIMAGGVSLTNMFGDWPYLEAPMLRTTAIRSLDGDDGEFSVGKNIVVGRNSVGIGRHIDVLIDDSSTNQTTLILGGHESWDSQGIRYTHNTGARSKVDVLEFGPSSMLSLGDSGELRCGDYNEGIRMYTNDSGVAVLRIGRQAEVQGLSGGGSDGGTNQAETLYANLIYPTSEANDTVSIFAHVTGIKTLSAGGSIYANTMGANTCYVDNITPNKGAAIAINADVTGISTLRAEAMSTHNFTAYHPNNYTRRITLGTPEGESPNAFALYLGEGVHITGPGWEEMQAAAAATAAEAEQPAFTKLIFPPTGTATAEQDPSWITKSNILMETNGGQLNMTQLTATLAYAAQTPLAIAKRTLWLSTSSGTGDAVQWPANAVFPDDQPQDKIQQLNSNSTYWFDITYVGGSDTVLIRKVCSWASTTGESGPTE